MKALDKLAIEDIIQRTGADKQAYERMKEEKKTEAREEMLSQLREEVTRKKDIEGVIFVKAEWDGCGDRMPPTKSETLFTLNNVEKNRLYATEE